LKKVVEVTYACEICDREHNTAQRALECEKRGIAIPEFKHFEVVELINLKSGETLIMESRLRFPFQPGLKAVIHENSDEECDNPHLLPYKYSLYFSTPEGLQLGSGVSREFLKKVRIKDGLTCPLCKSPANPIRERAYDYLYYSVGLPLLTKISVQRCTGCNVKFFTYAQSVKVGLLMIKKLRAKAKWPIANTKKLVREFDFQ